MEVKYTNTVGLVSVKYRVYYAAGGRKNAHLVICPCPDTFDRSWVCVLRCRARCQYMSVVTAPVLYTRHDLSGTARQSDLLSMRPIFQK